MARDFTLFLWLLKLGAPINLYLLFSASSLPGEATHLRVLVPAQILFVVSAFRCLFPNGYKGNVVLHDVPLSSIFLTRLLATFSEVAYVYLFSHVLRVLNLDRVGWIDALSWWMVAQVVISQGFVWGAILRGRLRLYFYEELGWAIIFAANTLASVHLALTLDPPAGRALLLHLNLLFGAVYLPWQVLHLRLQVSDARRAVAAPPLDLAEGLRRSLGERHRTTEATAWGGLVGLSWMVGYWATLIPLWVHRIAVVLAG